jgi:virulence factor
MMSGERLNVGVIGAGGIARSVHLPSLSEIEGASVVAVCDLIESRAAEQAERFGIPRTYTLFRRMLDAEDLDAVFVLVEPSNLFHVTVACLEAGLPTFMEKPPGITLYQARSLQRAAEKAGRILQVGFNRRFVPVVRKALDIMREHTEITQAIGRFMKCGTAAFDKGGVSAFRADTIHAADLVRAVAGSPPVSAATVRGQSEDTVANRWNSVVRFENGVTGVVQANYQTGGRTHTFEFHGPGASAFINLGTGGSECEARMLINESREGYSLAASGISGGSLLELDGKELAGSDAFHRYYGFYDEDVHFLKCVRTGEEPETSIGDAVRTFELVDMLESNVI